MFCFDFLKFTNLKKYILFIERHDEKIQLRLPTMNLPVSFFLFANFIFIRLLLVCLLACLFVCLFVCWFVYLFICLFVRLLFLSVCLGNLVNRTDKPST